MLKRIIIGAAAILGALLMLAALGSRPAETATQTAVSFTALPGGKLDKIKPGDYLSVGYIYKVTDITYPVDVGVIHPKVVLGLRCNQSGWGVTLEVKMPDYRDTSLNDKTNPDILQGSPDVDAQVWGYQGMVQVPDLCGANGSMTLDTNTGQATFSAEVQGNKAARVRMKFHLRDPQAKGYPLWVNCSDPAINPPKKPLGSQCSGSWSSEFSAYPSQFWTPTPTATPTAREPLAQILAVVTDANGNGVAGATVTARNNTSGAQVSGVSDIWGNAPLPLLGLGGGSYTVHIDPPTGYMVTSANDVVVNVVGIYTQNFTVALIPTATPPPSIPGPVSVSGLVFNDVNGNGQQCPPNGPISDCDKGVAGATISAIKGQTVMMTATSDANGSYALPLGFLIPPLPQGLYTIHIDPPDGYNVTTPRDVAVNVRFSSLAVNFGIQSMATPTPTPTP